jgi:hypothetical protein
MFMASATASSGDYYKEQDVRRSLGPGAALLVASSGECLLNLHSLRLGA